MLFVHKKVTIVLDFETVDEVGIWHRKSEETVKTSDTCESECCFIFPLFIWGTTLYIYMSDLPFWLVIFIEII